MDIQELSSYQLGMEEGREEEKLQVARNLLDILSDNVIVETTELGLETIRKLIEEGSYKQLMLDPLVADFHG